MDGKNSYKIYQKYVKNQIGVYEPIEDYKAVLNEINSTECTNRTKIDYVKNETCSGTTKLIEMVFNHYESTDGGDTYSIVSSETYNTITKWSKDCGYIPDCSTYLEYNGGNMTIDYRIIEDGDFEHTKPQYDGTDSTNGKPIAARFGNCVEIIKGDRRLNSQGTAICTYNVFAWDYGSDRLPETVTSITMYDSVLELGDWAFASCNNIQTVELSSNLQIINTSAFHSCNNLIYIEIPKSVKTIGNYAFLNCLNLKYIIYDGTSEEWSQITIGEDVFYPNPIIICTDKIIYL